MHVHYVYPQSQQRAAVGPVIITKQGGRGELKCSMSAANTKVGDLLSRPTSRGQEGEKETVRRERKTKKVKTACLCSCFWPVVDSSPARALILFLRPQ